MVNTLATDAPRTARFDEKKIVQTCGSSRPAILINGNASLKMHCSEKSNNEIKYGFIYDFIFDEEAKERVCLCNKKRRIYNYV